MDPDRFEIYDSLVSCCQGHLICFCTRATARCLTDGSLTVRIPVPHIPFLEVRMTLSLLSTRAEIMRFPICRVHDICRICRLGRQNPQVNSPYSDRLAGTSD